MKKKNVLLRQLGTHYLPLKNVLGKFYIIFLLGLGGELAKLRSLLKKKFLEICSAGLQEELLDSVSSSHMSVTPPWD